MTGITLKGASDPSRKGAPRDDGRPSSPGHLHLVHMASQMLARLSKAVADGHTSPLKITFGRTSVGNRSLFYSLNSGVIHLHLPTLHCKLFDFLATLLFLNLSSCQHPRLLPTDIYFHRLFRSVCVKHLLHHLHLLPIDLYLHPCTLSALRPLTDCPNNPDPALGPASRRGPLDRRQLLARVIPCQRI